MSEPIFADMVSSATTVLKHPVDVVWPRLLDQAAWMKDFIFETVDGMPNQEGEIKKITPVSAGFEHFFFKTLRVVPFRKFVYKAYTAQRSGRYGFTGIEVLTLGDLGHDSFVIFEAYLEVQSSTMSQEELTQFVITEKAESPTLWARNFQNLASRLTACVNS